MSSRPLELLFLKGFGRQGWVLWAAGKRACGHRLKRHPGRFACLCGPGADALIGATAAAAAIGVGQDQAAPGGTAANKAAEVRHLPDPGMAQKAVDRANAEAEAWKEIRLPA